MTLGGGPRQTSSRRSPGPRACDAALAVAALGGLLGAAAPAGCSWLSTCGDEGGATVTLDAGLDHFASSPWVEDGGFWAYSWGPGYPTNDPCSACAEATGSERGFCTIGDAGPPVVILCEHTCAP